MTTEYLNECTYHEIQYSYQVLLVKIPILHKIFTQARFRRSLGKLTNLNSTRRSVDGRKKRQLQISSGELLGNKIAFEYLTSIRNSRFECSLSVARKPARVN